MLFMTAYVAAVPTKEKDTYFKHIEQAADLFKQHGATRVVECWGSDVPAGELTSFPLAVKCEPDETVVIGFVEWPSKESHDENMPKVMEGMREHMKKGTLGAPPFDGKRLIFGSFDVILER